MLWLIGLILTCSPSPGGGVERSQLHVDVLSIRISSLPDSNIHPSRFPPPFSLIFPARWMMNHLHTCSSRIYFAGLPTHLTQIKEGKYPVLEEPRAQPCDADALMKAIDVTL